MGADAVVAYSTPKVEVIDHAEALVSAGRTRGSSSSSSSSPPSSPASSSPSRTPGTREPDIAVTAIERDLDVTAVEGDADGSGLSPDPKKIKFRTHSPPLAVIEVTSKSTRTEDLYQKWTAYARTGISLYIILDRPSARKSKSEAPQL